MMNLKHFDEPKLTFGNGQTAEDPRDGLMLFGANEQFKRNSIKAGVVATSEGLVKYKDFVKRLQSPIFSKKVMYGKEYDNEVQRPSYIGFEATFGIEWNEEPVLKKLLDSSDVEKILAIDRKPERTRKLVDYYANKIIGSRGKDDKQIDLWFVIVPRSVYMECRYNSKGKDITAKEKKQIELLKQGQESLFKEFDEELLELERLKDDSTDFHNLIKAELLKNKIQSPIQVIVEPTLEFKDKLLLKELGDDMKAHLAWTQSVAVYYKLGNKPWILNDVRKDVCYLGLIFKKVPDKSNKRSVSSAAQMFLEDGDGSIFRGNIGLFKSEDSIGYHLDEESAEKLLNMALEDFFESQGNYPKELFIHGRVQFEDEEWKGFMNAIESHNADTQLNGILIKDTRSDSRRRLKLFKETFKQKNNYGVMRGLGWVINDESGYLFTRGFIPRLGSTNHLETANPLYIEVNRGSAHIETVMQDVLALTKLNYNACVYGDGLPVTLRFSDLIGNILTATKNWESEMRQFKYYI